MNEEIRLFRSLHGEGAILCALIDGTLATSFPPALLEGGREPLAADLSANSFKLGVTQIAASMLGVGLDDLVQRDQKRRRRRAQILATFATAFSAVMGLTAYSAVQSRNDAELSRAQAEGLVEYMITDMRDQLRPVGRLDILDGVGRRAVRYYDTQDLNDLPDDSLIRQAHARMVIGEVALDQGDVERATDQIEQAHYITEDIFERNSNEEIIIYAHAQSEYWLGRLAFKKKDKVSTLKHWTKYLTLTKLLYKSDETNINWVLERGYGENNLGFIHIKLGNNDLAEAHYINALSYFQRAVEIDSGNVQANTDLANLYAGLARIMIKKNDFNEAWKYRRLQIGLYDSLLSEDINDFPIRFRRVQVYCSLVIDKMFDRDDPKLLEAIDFIFHEYDHILLNDPANETWKVDYVMYLNGLSRLAQTDYLKNTDLEEIKNRHSEVEKGL